MRDATHHLTHAVRAGVDTSELATLAPRLFASVPLDANAPTSGKPVHAHANHGRWVVQCPDCAGAQLTHPADPRFLCNDCGNVGNARHFRPVAWPKDHEKIADLLDARADETLRNWFPGETVADLQRENEQLAGATILGAPDWTHRKWEGHTHRYPKRLPDPAQTPTVECSECGMPAPVRAVQDDRDAGLKGTK